MQLEMTTKAELSTQMLHLSCEIHNEFDTDKVEAASAAQIFNTTQNPNRLVIKTPAAARGIHYRRHKSVFEI
jgi:hypothetical protein